MLTRGCHKFLMKSEWRYSSRRDTGWSHQYLWIPTEIHPRYHQSETNWPAQNSRLRDGKRVILSRKFSRTKKIYLFYGTRLQNARSPCQSTSTSLNIKGHVECQPRPPSFPGHVGGHYLESVHVHSMFLLRSARRLCSYWWSTGVDTSFQKAYANSRLLPSLLATREHVKFMGYHSLALWVKLASWSVI